MDQLDQIQIIQEIVNRAIQAADPNWSELMITYHVAGGQSEFVNTYLTYHDGEIREKDLPVARDMNVWLRKLQAELSRGGGEPFTLCKLHVCADGRFNATYGYDPVDWDKLLTDPVWNFPHATSLH